MIAVTSPGMRRERHAGERRLLGARILERHVLEFDVPALGRELRLHRRRRIDDLRRDVQHLVDARGRRRRARQHHEHRGDHEHGEENLHRVLQRRDHRADLHRALRRCGGCRTR